MTLAKREETLTDEEACLGTGNLKHFPVRTFILTPAEMLSLIEG